MIGNPTSPRYETLWQSIRFRQMVEDHYAEWEAKVEKLLEKWPAKIWHGDAALLTFMEAFLSWEKLNRGPHFKSCLFASWRYHISKLDAYEYRREQGKKRIAEGARHKSANFRKHSMRDVFVDMDNMSSLIAGLVDPEHYQIMYMRFVLGFTYKEIAQEMPIAVFTIRRRAKAALVLLREKLLTEGERHAQVED